VKPTEVADNVVVQLEYTLTLEDGEVADSSVGSAPLEYLHGAGEIVEGLESRLTGMKVGDTGRVVIPPEEAYGPYDPEATEEVDRGLFPQDMTLEEGMGLQLTSDDGTPHVAFVAEVSDDVVVLDFNHPLAGETLTFDVKIINLREASEEELAHGHAHQHGSPHAH